MTKEHIEKVIRSNKKGIAAHQLFKEIESEQKEFKFALTWLLDIADNWRGSLIGNPDPVPLMNYDANINRCKAALYGIDYKKLSIFNVKT